MGHKSSRPRLRALPAPEVNVSLRSLIVRAYGLKDFQVEGPDWIGSERYDIAAKFPEGLPKDKEA